MTKTKKILIAIAVLLLVILLSAMMFACKRKQFAAVPDYRTLGPAKAPITIVEFTDMQCPACARGHGALGEILRIYGGNVRVELKHYPLEMHRWSVQSAVAAECAGRQGKFWQYADQLFVNQQQWGEQEQEPEAYFEAYAMNSGGINMPVFAACRKDPGLRGAVLSDRTEGEKHGVDSTPTFFVNGKMLKGGRALLEETAGFDSIIKRRK